MRSSPKSPETTAYGSRRRRFGPLFGSRGIGGACDDDDSGIGTPPATLACCLAAAADFAHHEGMAYFLPKVLPGDWLFLGPGKGLRATRSGDSIGLTPDPDVVVTPSPIRIEDGTWASD